MVRFQFTPAADDGTSSYASPMMCRTLGFKYSCNCQIDTRRSTCHGRFTRYPALYYPTDTPHHHHIQHRKDDNNSNNKSNNTHSQSASDERRRPRCTSQPYLVLHISGPCGMCATADAKADITCCQGAAMAAATETRERWFTLVREEAPADMAAACKAELDALLIELKAMEYEVSSADVVLGRVYPAGSFEGRIAAAPYQRRRRGSWARGSLLTREVRREDVSEDETSPIERGLLAQECMSGETEVWDGEWPAWDRIDHTQQDSHPSLEQQDLGLDDQKWRQQQQHIAVADEEGGVQQGGSGYLEGEPWNHDEPKTVLQEGQPWYRFLSPVWEMSDESFTDNDDDSGSECHSNGTAHEDINKRSEESILVHTSDAARLHRIRSSSSQWSRPSDGCTGTAPAKIISSQARIPTCVDDTTQTQLQPQPQQPAQPIAPPSRSVTPTVERVSSPYEDFCFPTPIKDLASSLRIPSGLVPPLRLIPKFSFEGRPTADMVVCRDDLAPVGVEGEKRHRHGVMTAACERRFKDSSMETETTVPSVPSSSLQVSEQQAKLLLRGNAREIVIRSPQRKPVPLSGGEADSSSSMNRPAARNGTGSYPSTLQQPHLGLAPASLTMTTELQPMPDKKKKKLVVDGDDGDDRDGHVIAGLSWHRDVAYWNWDRTRTAEHWL